MPKSGTPLPTMMNAYGRVGAEKDPVKKQKRIDTMTAETDRVAKTRAPKATLSNAPKATPTKGMKMLPLKRGK